jgi:thiol-disulfide isomerase/thioredoxin
VAKTKARGRVPHPNSNPHPRRYRRPFNWKPWAIAAAGVLGLGLLVFLAQNTGRSVADPEVEALARANAGTDIDVLTGTRHTVYHSKAPLPDRSDPRADGKPTLVWFSGTWCEYCEQMEPFAHATAAAFRDQVVFVEKSIDHDKGAANRYGVRGTPTFVLIDAGGREMARFSFQSTSSRFQAAIKQAMDRAGPGG